MQTQTKEKFIFDILTSSRGKLTPFERLYIIHRLSPLSNLNQRWLVDLYMNCGCFSEAQAVYETLKHWRKLGDLAWIKGNLATAEECYLKDDEYGEVFRSGKDWDRLIKLYFFQSEWHKLINVWLKANAFPILTNQIVIAGSTVASGPYLKMTAIAAIKAAELNDITLIDNLKKTFSLKQGEWERLVLSLAEITDVELAAFQKKVVPRSSRQPHISSDEALNKGETDESRRLVLVFKDPDNLVSQSADAVVEYFKRGDVSQLDHFVDSLNQFSDDTLQRTFIDSVRSASFDRLGILPAPDLVIQLYEIHPMTRRIYFRDILSLKLQNKILLTSSDLLTGMLQMLSSVEYEIKMMAKEEKGLDFEKIIEYSDWAEIKIEEWLSLGGKSELDGLAAIWNENRAERVKSFYEPKHYPNSPIEMKEWKRLLNDLKTWLSRAWEKEIGYEKWITEKTLFEVVSNKLKPYKVIRHARPIWLDPQHLDIYIPELSVAIEYMGEQHYRPVDYFGGSSGFSAALKRDEKKSALCIRAGIRLYYIRYDDDFGKKSADIIKDILDNC